MENEEELEEWDESFLEQAIRLEEQVLSSSNPTQHRHTPPPPPPYAVNVSCYSPPRELSQRNRDEPIVKLPDHFANGRFVADFVAPVVSAKDQEIDRLKRELGRVSKQLTHLEQECVDLRKERDKKEEKFRPVISRVEEKDPEVLYTKNGNHDFSGEYGVNNHDYSAAAPLGQRDLKTSNHAVGCQINVACKTVGVQTDIAVESTDVIVKDELSTFRQCSKKLLGIWDSTLEQKTGKNLGSKLFLACETDFHDLFGYLNLNSSIKTTVASVGHNASLQRNAQPTHSAEAAKVSHLYYLFTKISNGMVRMEALLEAVVDLCCLENVFIVCRSLHILRIVLNNLLSWERKFDRRDCVVIEEPASGNTSSQKIGSICSQKRSSFLWNSSETVFKKKVRDPGSTSTIVVNWISLFELMHQIIMKHPVEHVRLEAVSIMNVIVMRANAYSERESYGKGVVFQSVSKLLRMEAGFDVQNQAVHLLYLLLNCPKVMSTFCSGYKDEIVGAGSATSDARNTSDFQQFSEILDGLADCVSCFGNSTPGLHLRRNAITLLAFLASSGMSGFEILVSHKLSKRNNFFALILQVVVSEIDVEASDCVQPSEIFKERTLLIREALIFLNRLVSNAQYSGPVLRILTNSRDVAFLTVDIANRLSQKGKWLWQSDTMTRQIRESEIVELARVFKKRVFNFLGDTIL